MLCSAAMLSTLIYPMHMRVADEARVPMVGSLAIPRLKIAPDGEEVRQRPAVTATNRLAHAVQLRRDPIADPRGVFAHVSPDRNVENRGCAVSRCHSARLRRARRAAPVQERHARFASAPKNRLSCTTGAFVQWPPRESLALQCRPRWDVPCQPIDGHTFWGNSCRLHPF